MAQLPDPAAAWEALDVDDSDICLGRPSASPLLSPCAAPTSHPHEDKPPHLSHHHHGIPEPATAAAAAAQDMPPPSALGRGDARAPDADFLLSPWLCALQFLGEG
jgi:hypothetical protein